jgi:hypothetical protein
MIVGVRYCKIFVDEILFYVVFEKDEYERKCIFLSLYCQNAVCER